MNSSKGKFPAKGVCPPVVLNSHNAGCRSETWKINKRNSLNMFNQRYSKWSCTAVAAMGVGIFALAGCSSESDREESGVSSELRDEAVASAGERYQRVLEMQPVGYWPADQGVGDVLVDLSRTQNNGVMRHVPWDEQRQLPDFTGAYQWLEIPKHAAYQTPAFSMGGWVFMRSEVIGSGWVNRQGLLLIGNRRQKSWQPDSGVQLAIRRQELIDVMSDGKEDVLATRMWVDRRNGQFIRRSEGEPNLPIGKWQHLLYSFEPDNSLSKGNNLIGTGSLYLNGVLIATKTGISYQPADLNLQIGNDAWWWMQTNEKSGSLDGSVRDMVWFDRVLSESEASQLYAATKPSVMPDVYDDSVVVLDGRAIAAHDLASLPSATGRTALVLFNRKAQATLQPLANALLPALTAALDEPNGRLQAVNLLRKLDSDAANAVLKQAAPKLLDVVQDQAKAPTERAEAALALAAIGKTAIDTVPSLAETLDKLVAEANTESPRVEELLRNALTRALLDIAPENAQARKVLERTYAAPMLAKIDLDNPQLTNDARYGELRFMIDGGQYLEAMRLYGQLPDSVREYFFTYKAPQARDYTSTVYFNGCTYKVGEGIAWKGVEKVPQDEYKVILAGLTKDYPAAENWRKPDYEHLYRVPITKITAEGKEQKIYLEGENFILDGEDEKLRGWSIFIDELGYIHLMGGQHNTPNPKLYIPGSWEKIGAASDKNSNDSPLQMYWVSSEPENIESLQFAGQRRNPQAIPASYLNYMVLEQSPSNETYLYGRVDAFGFQCWGMFRYDAAVKRWTAVGGDPYELIESARRHDPTWLNYLHDSIKAGDNIPSSPSDSRVLAWAWQPPFYNFCRDAWGVRFDKTGRMHVLMQISGLDGAGYVRPTSVYAWSDDRGLTFHRADGSILELPLTVNPAPEHNAEIAVDNTLQHHNGRQFAIRQWWDLWLGLIRESGYRY